MLHIAHDSEPLAGVSHEVSSRGTMRLEHCFLFLTPFFSFLLLPGTAHLPRPHTVSSLTRFHFLFILIEFIWGEGDGEGE